MTKSESAYTLLLMLSVVDGSIDAQERAIIKLFIGGLFHEEVDYEQIETALVNMDASELLSRFGEAAKAFSAQSTAEERVGLLLSGLEVVLADGVMGNEETAIFRGLADVWGLKYDAILDHFRELHATKD